MVTPVAGTNLLSFYQSQTALSLLTSSTTSSTTGQSSSSTNSALLLSYLTNKEGITSSTSSSSTVKAPTAPWNSSTGVPSVSTAVQNAINGTPFVDPSAAKLNAPGGVSTSDYQNLFALYQGLNTLNDLATTAVSAGTASASSSLANITSSQLQATFNSGISQIQNFLSNAPFKEFNLTSGKVNTTEQSTVGIPNGTSQTTYTTGVIGTGQEESPLAALQGNVQFTISVGSQYGSTTVTNPDGSTSTITTPPTNINIDLSNMGSKPRTIDNVVNYINAQLKAAGVTTTFAAANLGDAPVTTTVNGKTTTTNTGNPQWGLTINSGASNTVSFSAPSTSTALYVGMGTGGAKTFTSSTTTSSSASSSTTPTGEQLMKLQTANNVVGTAPTLTSSSSNSNLPTGGVFADALPDGVTSVQASATAPDGSVYVLADASGTLNGAPVPGTQGVALLKYDSAGKLLYSKVLPGQQDATGFSLAVSSTGSVAVAGTNTVAPSVSSTGVTTPGSTSAFVQVYDSSGAPTWSQTVPAAGGASAASGVAFSPDGSTVYLSGATTGSVGAQTPKGSSDEFIQGFMNTVTTAQSNAGDYVGQPTFTTQYGATGGANTSSGMTVDPATGIIYTAGLENGQAVVRSFSPNGSKEPTALATRALGSADSLVGIGVSNGQVVVGGNVSQATITASGTVTQPFTGVEDGFVASISTNLTPQSSDTVTYLGQAGATQTATGMTVSGGVAYLTGTEANDPNSVASTDATEGFVTGVNASSGAIAYTSKFAGANGQAVPTAISAAGAGASVLDQLGLPTGTLNPASSGLITAATSIQAGQSFYVRTSPGGAQTQITITASDTLTTLANKLNAALGASGKATVQAIGANSELEITPNDSSDFIELDSQPASNDTSYSQQSSSSGTDVLSALGLSSGVIRTVATINGLTDVKQLREYGMDLPTNLNLTTAANAQHASNAIQAAMSAVQSAYQDLVTPPTMAAEQAAKAQSTGGTVPTYLTNEIANYQAGLQRLTAGESTSTSSSSASGGVLSLFG